MLYISKFPLPVLVAMEKEIMKDHDQYKREFNLIFAKTKQIAATLSEPNLLNLKQLVADRLVVIKCLILVVKRQFALSMFLCRSLMDRTLIFLISTTNW